MLVDINFEKAPCGYALILSPWDHPTPGLRVQLNHADARQLLDIIMHVMHSQADEFSGSMTGAGFVEDQKT